MKLHLHPVWEQTLPEKGKAELTAAFLTLPPSHSFGAFPFLIKRKKNGGVVATVFLQNGTVYPVAFEQIQVLIYDEKKRMAQHIFEESLVVPASSAMPWSFVFPPASTEEGEIRDQLTVVVDLLK
ncbi:SLAP domain-containing protein [Sporosarcina sp. Te-1]|uniref:SLAP domain-containing protein n=1 Tax=Sporosarcina sp. Te-1 TaxID=2818390 RepID=UPI001A9D2279|nr:SLAP domain-containing protein [Sporosarcina sp. Te-1]QTD41795.1 SLAP domain-containing protein [Sporosarcina sp. Te-1]